MARLVVESGPDEGMVYPLQVGIITIGRSPNNAIQVIDKRTSRQHAQITYENGRVTVCDLDSKNGTYVNSNRLEGEISLHNGDQVLIGETTLAFERDPEESPTGLDSTSNSVRLVADMAWGQEQSSMEAGIEAAAPPRDTGKATIDATERLRLLYEMSNAIRSVNGIDDLMEIVMDSLFALLEPDRAFIMMVDEKSKSLSPAMVRFKEGTQTESQISVSRTIVDRCLEDKVSLLVSDALSDVRFKASESIVIQKIRSAICAPMICREEVMGVIYLDTRTRPDAYGREELELATGVANQAAIGISNTHLQSQMIQQRTMEREMEIARDIQMRLLPPKMPKARHFDIAAMSLPAKKVGGDYYDALDLDGERFGLAIADVSGKGVPAAILIASVRSALQAQCAREGLSVPEILENLNDLVFRDTANNMFVTMVFGVLNCATRTFEYANAGHPYPLLFAPDGGLTELETGGCFLGISKQVEYVKGVATLKPGGTLVLYSDGVTDTLSPSGELYGRKRLIEVIRDNLDAPAEVLRDKIYKSTGDFQGSTEQFDDFTLMVVRNTESE